MAIGIEHPIVILCRHELLGEGIAQYLLAHLDVRATVASADDLDAVTAALALGPAAVIFELTDTLRQVDLAALAAAAVRIDVSTVVGRGTAATPGAAGLERILLPCAAAIGARAQGKKN